jgi:hypothetical protein
MGALQCPTSDPPSAVTGEAGDKEESKRSREAAVSAIKPYEGFGDVDHTIKELMSL